jgi:hypothetical protein
MYGSTTFWIDSDDEGDEEPIPDKCACRLPVSKGMLLKENNDGRDDPKWLQSLKLQLLSPTLCIDFASKAQQPI